MALLLQIILIVTINKDIPCEPQYKGRDRFIGVGRKSNVWRLTDALEQQQIGGPEIHAVLFRRLLSFL